MGYTHYFRTKKTTDEKWDKIIEDCQKLANNMPKYSDSSLLIDDQKGGKPIFNKEMILFNGTEEDFEYKDGGYPESSHETFTLEKEPKPYGSEIPGGDGVFSFCKTAQKPYDLMVCACLLVYKYYSPDTIELSSDGNEKDWQPAKRFVKEVLGLNIDAGLGK